MSNAAVPRTAGGVSELGGSKGGAQGLVSVLLSPTQGWRGGGCAEAEIRLTASVCNLQSTSFLSCSFEEQRKVLGDVPY